MTWPRRIASSVTGGITELRAQPGIFFGLCGLAAILMFTYGLARPPAKSMFIDVYGSDDLPWAWLAVAGTAIVIAWIYGWFAERFPVGRMFLASASLIAAAFVGLRVAIGADLPHSVFAMYVLMETYIVVLVESFWSLASLTYNLKSARVAYGLFCASGSIGALVAEGFQPTLARSVGTEDILWGVAPVLILTGLLCSRIGARVGVAAPRNKPQSIIEGWRLVTESRYLWLILLIVASSQIVINVADYALSYALEHEYVGEAMRDQRTAAFGKVYATINVVALVLQFLTGPIVGALGVMLVLFLIPGIIGAAMTAAFALPRALTTSAAFVAAKAFDYSLFRAAKEMLYLPLDARSKTVGKSFVDMTTYRAAKAGAAGLVLVLVPLGMRVAVGAAVAIAAMWILFTVLLAPRYHAEREAADGS